MHYARWYRAGRRQASDRQGDHPPARGGYQRTSVIRTRHHPRRAPGAHYTAGEPDTSTTLINGTIRAGRSFAVRQNLMKAISQSWSSITGQPEEQLIINITEVDASTVIEAGLILPRPGEEAAWFEHNRAQRSRLAPDGIKGL